ncbi:MAG TPA: GDP-L-fucose synthase [bacterium]|nr:GDP-L-fucose synthase [bacterium]
MEKNSLIYIAGHRGLAGSAITNELRNNGYQNLLLRTSGELDLRNQHEVEKFFNEFKPEYVVLAAARVGGIGANSRFRAQMIYDNLMIQSNVIHHSYLNGVKKLLFLGSSCIYPKFAPQPMKEEYLLTSSLEPTNEPYAIAKIAGIKMCEAYNFQYNTDFITVMPTNLYGENDNFDLENGHVLPVMIRKFHEAKINSSPFVELWGSGKPRREFLYSRDLAKAVVLLLNSSEKYKTHINIGSGKDIPIKELAELIKDIVGFSGDIKWNGDMPDGTPQKLLDITKISQTGWVPELSLLEGIKKVYRWYSENHE